MISIDAKFWIGDRVIIDGEQRIVAVVTSIEVRRQTVIRYEVSYWQGGDCKFCTFDDWRLSPAPGSNPKIVYEDVGS